MKSVSTAPLMAMYRPHLVPLTPNLTAAVFPLMKILPAELAVRRAIQDGLIDRDSVVIETSSGTMALGLALVCNWLGLTLVIVTDYACDQVLKTRLEDLGARVERVAAPAQSGGYQRARLDRIFELQAEDPKCWWVNQYDNPANPGAYSSFASQIVEEIGHIDCLVGSVGSGGSMCGSSQFLRTLFPELHVVGVDTFNSVLFGQRDGPRKLRGLGNSILPRNLDHSVFDEIHWVSAAEAYTATRLLHRSSGLYTGGTSGASWLVARYWAERNAGKHVVCVCPDAGHRYSNDIYDDAYLHANSLWTALPHEPRGIERPEEAGPSWSHMHWGRRSIDAIAPLALSAAARA